MTSCISSCPYASTTRMAGAGGSSVPSDSPGVVAVDVPITLGRFVKVSGLASTGGEAKQLIVAGLVRVNGAVEIHRGHKLGFGDIVEVRGSARQVATRQVSRSDS